nr:putative transmembrane protein [Ipomoea batatas]GME21401.1 putative transmembrane protein [Ipomoea batatas]
MDGFQQFGVPVVGIVAVAALTFYAVSFMEMSEKSFRDLDEKEDSENGGFNPALRFKERTARKKAQKRTKP